MTSTCGRLRAARYSFSSLASTTISTEGSDHALSCCARSLVFGASRLMPSVTRRRSVRASSDNIERSAPRYIFRLTFCAKSRGLAAKVLPPPTQIGEREEPARAWPVPFWACGLRPPPRTSARDFCALVPERPALRYAVITWCTRASLNLWPKAASDTCSVAPPLTDLSFISCLPSPDPSTQRIPPCWAPWSCAWRDAPP